MACLFANNSSFQVLRLRENCEENRMLCERFLSDYREIFEAKHSISQDGGDKLREGERGRDSTSCLLADLYLTLYHSTLARSF